MKKFTLLFIVLVAMTNNLLAANAKKIYLKSPDGNIKVEINTVDTLNYTLFYKGNVLIEKSKIGLIKEDDVYVGNFSKPPRISKRNAVENIESPFYRFKSFALAYNEVTIALNDNFDLVLRLYNEGLSYRFVNNNKGVTIIKNEISEFNFKEDFTAYAAYTTNEDKPFASAFQNFYHSAPISELKNLPAYLPLSVDCKTAFITVCESDLEAYPGMYLQKSDRGALCARFPEYPAGFDYFPWRQQKYVTSTENFISKTEGVRSYPWRILALSENEKQMPVNNLVYALASPNRTGNTDWIVTGKSAWDWWNDWNLSGVNFTPGINTETYKYYIDFAARNNLEYIILDEGWYKPASGDMLVEIPQINIKELCLYARQRGVGIILWTVFNVLDSQLEQACKKYSELGVKGFKVDFLDRDDQTAVETAYRIAKKCAEYHLVLDYHGFYKPTGLNRTYPNIINFESVFGMEEVKWTSPQTDFPLYDVTFPFIRMAAGPVDYTPGAMRNASKDCWRAVYSSPMSMGTRSHQIATYIVFDSPLTMLADAPSAYLREKNVLDYISSIPCDIDSTFIIDGKIGEYIVSARKKDCNFFVGGLTNQKSCDLKLNLDFLTINQTYNAEIFRDGTNAEKNAEDYCIEKIKVKKSDVINLHLASGGGFAIKFIRAADTTRVSSIPEGKNIPDFYKKFAVTDGLYVTSSAAVDDKALLKATEIMQLMLLKRSDIKAAMIKAGCHTMIIGQYENTCDIPEYAGICDTQDHIAYINKRARGFGGAPEDSLSSACGEENILALPYDRYQGENIFIHEFAHLIHTKGIMAVEPDFNTKLEQLRQNAIKNNLWSNTYALTDIYEYFAESVQSFFNCNRYADPANGVHNMINRRSNLKLYDPQMYKLLKNYFFESEIPIYNSSK